MGLIDFGCVKRFDIWWLARYAKMALAIVDDEQPAFIQRAQDLDVMSEEVQPQAEQVLWRLARTVCSFDRSLVPVWGG